MMSEHQNEQSQKDTITSNQDHVSGTAKGIPSAKHNQAMQLQAMIQNSPKMQRLQSFQDSADQHAAVQRQPISGKQEPTSTQEGESGDPVYDAIDWSAITRGEPFQVKKGKTSIYGIIRARGWAETYGPSVTAHIIQHLRARYEKSKPPKMTDNLNFKEGEWITVPNFKSYQTYMAQRAKADDPAIKPFYNQHLAQAVPQEQEKENPKVEEQKKTETNAQTDPKKKPSDKTELSGNVGGYTKGDHVGTLHVAWTFDDGPNKTNTPEMDKAMDGDRSTWYVVYSNILKDKENYLKALKARQDAGGEIAIHSPHPKIDHMNWFPATRKATKDGESSKTEDAKGGHYGYNSVEDTMKGLGEFKKLLTKYGIKTKFVRLPGGLVSELAEYARTLGFGKTSGIVAREVIKGKEYSKTYGGSKANYDTIAKDFKTFKTGLNKLGLLAWGGAAKPLTIPTQTWEAESSGGKLSNNAPEKMSTLIGSIAKEQKDRSLVILAHDTSPENVKAVDKAKAAAENKAKSDSAKVLIKYHTMSSLFQQVTGENPETLNVDYK